MTRCGTLLSFFFCRCFPTEGFLHYARRIRASVVTHRPIDTHAERPRGDREGEQRVILFFSLIFFCALIWFGFGFWRCKGGLCKDADGIGNPGLELIERVHWWDGTGSPGVDRVHYLARRKAGRRGVEWSGWEGKDQWRGQSIYTCEWAPVHRNREWHFFSARLNSSI